MTDLGHNSVDNEQLKTIIERIERAEEEKREVGAFIRDIYKEAAGNGFDAKQLRRLVAERRRKNREEEDAILEIYRRAGGN